MACNFFIYQMSALCIVARNREAIIVLLAGCNRLAVISSLSTVGESENELMKIGEKSIYACNRELDRLK